jgi:RNA polymerase sigma factor (sigma-70 family)
MNNFYEFKQGLDSKDNNSWDILRTNISIVVRNWCLKEYYEINWTEYKGRLLDESGFYGVVYNIFSDKYDLIKDNLDTYENLKNEFVGIASDVLNKGFPGFMERIKSNENAAWIIFDKRIRNVLKAWLFRKGFCSLPVYERIFSEAIYTFFDNFRKEPLNFENSKKLKSYILRIAEFKLKEYKRLELDKRTVNLENLYEKDIAEMPVLQYEQKEQHEKVEKILSVLNYEEKQILYGVFFYDMKIKDIANTLNVSEESCRVKKHRALKKLQEEFSQVWYLNI